jgi:hypothetical protein
MKHRVIHSVGVAGLLTIAAVPMASAEDVPIQAQIDQIKGVLPKFAIPMREVGDRFQNMYFAAKGGNWALAAYMSKYMDKSLNPASYTKPEEYQSWRYFYDTTFAPVNKAIQDQDFKTFAKEYTDVIESCNACHASMGYGFIKVVKQKEPSDKSVNYAVPSKAKDVPN